MGYRSDVGLALTRHGVETLENRLASPELGEGVRKRVREFFDYADKHAKDEESGHEAWYWDYLKWYDDDPAHFPEVDFIEKLMSELPYEDFRFIRIGEDYDDTELRGGFWENPFDMELGRYISFSEAV
ncbi:MULTISPECIES: hypothetical protein [unclassified Desulfovibrio]|uniref:hypothetical protein n=1 Tax=unclassified Desulfovibrio TaxID=2593640 RepID=UPI0013EA6A9E|nr:MULTISPECIES: hypothetical protein [unclassified Desulfovibrio]